MINKYDMNLKGRCIVSDRIKYKVDEANGVVTAILSDTRFDAMGAVENIIAKHLDEVFDISSALTIDSKYKWGWIPDRFIGVAKCSKLDKFDVEIGKRIALDRLNKKYYASKAKAIAKILDHMFSLKNTIYSAIEGCYDMYCQRSYMCEQRNIAVKTSDKSTEVMF